ncbi:TRAP transporter substrate-binding protein [Acidovorax sp. GBBC 3334]|uniref:TRAP transporter substrate-binding protein n=1 Tax=Acidovorax sp. GBBC 3334 TaxID=2940496 RepID=UPI0023046754|nr:TRAP transporter substrate-binding protein [Acidovorax sp. GBBC 3334]MDA8455864.1 TRAP transporter substrate-binding protein [Acidovorax sp. GBBC 3334]
MTPTTRRFFARAGALALAAACLAPSIAAAQVAWTLASGYPADLFHTVNLRQFADDVKARTRGALAIDLRADNSAARLPEIAAKVRSGEIAAGEVLLSSLAGEAKIAGADAIPFIVNSYEDAQRFWTAQRPVLQEALDRQGLVVLYAVPWPAQGLFTARPIRAMADLRGAKMRTYNPSTVRIAQLVGAAPVDVPTQGIHQAFVERRVDAMFTSPATGVDGKVWETPVKYFYNVRGWYPKNLVVANKAKWMALPEATRQAVQAAAAEAQKRGWAASDAAASASVAELARNGIKVETPEPELRRELRRLGEHFAVEYLRETGAEGNRVLIPYFAGDNGTTAAAKSP